MRQSKDGNITEKKDFEVFKRECNKWIDKFGLWNHRFYFQHENIDANAIAYCIFPDDPQDRVFTLGLMVSVDSYPKLTLKDIRRSAFHEVMEAFLYRIQNLASCRFVLACEIEDEIHNIIRILENTIFEK